MPMVMPIGPLMIEHRLIERMIAIMKKQFLRSAGIEWSILKKPQPEI